MYDTVAFYTFLALILFFVATEIYRVTHHRKGTVVAFRPARLGVEEFILSRMEVQLSDGAIIEAEASKCTMCMGNIQIGDTVYITRTNDKYLVNLPFSLNKKSGFQNTCAR